MRSPCAAIRPVYTGPMDLADPDRIPWLPLTSADAARLAAQAGNALRQFPWVLAAWLHGSLVRGERPPRDLDFAVLTDRRQLTQREWRQARVTSSGIPQALGGSDVRGGVLEEGSGGSKWRGRLHDIEAYGRLYASISCGRCPKQGKKAAQRGIAAGIGCAGSEVGVAPTVGRPQGAGARRASCLRGQAVPANVGRGPRVARFSQVVRAEAGRYHPGGSSTRRRYLWNPGGIRRQTGRLRCPTEPDSHPAQAPRCGGPRAQIAAAPSKLGEPHEAAHPLRPPL